MSEELLRKYLGFKYKYDMYRHDYSATNKSPNSQSTNLYGSNYYVVNSDLKVYICIDNGSSGASGSGYAKGGNSLDEPTFTDTNHRQQVQVVMDMFGNIFTISL